MSTPTTVRDDAPRPSDGTVAAEDGAATRAAQESGDLGGARLEDGSDGADVDDDRVLGDLVLGVVDLEVEVVGGRPLVVDEGACTIECGGDIGRGAWDELEQLAR